MNLLHVLAVRLFRYLPTWVIKCAVYMLKRKYVIGVVAVVPGEGGTFLFLHHTYRKHNAWRLPGGLQERREEPFETVVRELKEEVNMTVQPVQMLAVKQSEITLDVAVLCEVIEIGTFHSNIEVDEYAWVDPFHAPFDIPAEQMAFIMEAIHRRADQTGFVANSDRPPN